LPQVRHRAGVILLLAAWLTLMNPVVADPRHDPESGRIRILFTGELHGNVNLFVDWYKLEPRMTIDIVPASPQDMQVDEAKRLVRLYMPRNFEELSGKYDCVVIEDLSPEVLSESFIPNLRRSITETGQGAVLVEFVFWFGNGNRIDLWMASTFYDIVPADVVFGQEIPTGMDNFYETVTYSEILDLPGMEENPMNKGHHGAMIARPGTTVLAKWRGTDYECVTLAEADQGTIIQIGHGWDNIPSETAKGWGYLQDYAYNLIFGTTGHEIPEDLELVRRARSLIKDSADYRSLVFSVLEFAEKFGANTRDIASDIAEIDDRRVEGNQAYIDGEYELAADVYEELLNAYKQAEEDALALKDRALLWVYVIEWLAVSGTCLISGFVLYSLMIRRRMYREVAVTRSAAERRTR